MTTLNVWDGQAIAAALAASHYGNFATVYTKGSSLGIGDTANVVATEGGTGIFQTSRVVSI